MFHRFTQEFGPSLLTLPWKSPAEARTTLPERCLRDLTKFTRWLDTCWHEEDAVTAVARAVSCALPESRTFAFPRGIGDVPGWIFDSFDTHRVHDFSDVATDTQSSNPFRRALSAREQLNARCYDEDPHGPLTNRPVNNTTLVEVFGSGKLTVALETIWEPWNVTQQLRTVLYSKKMGPLYFGAFRAKSDARFSLLDHARLFALQEPLLNWWRIASVIGLQPLVESQLTQSLVRLNDAALLLHKGKVVFVNPVASAHSGQIPKWLSAVKQGKLGSFPLQLADLRLELVLTPVRDTHLAPSSLKQPLPSYLAPVYQGLEKGLADKEIAQATSLSLETTRTYVKRIFAHLNVHSRREIIALRGSSPIAVPDADSSPKR